MGPFVAEALALVKDLGRRIKVATGEPRSESFLVQRISLAIQRGNAACVLATIPQYSKLHEIYHLNLFLLLYYKMFLCGSLNKGLYNNYYSNP